jgi:hypothetical protein
MNSHRVPVPAPFTRVRDVVEGLTCLEGVFLARGDRRGVFVTAYLTVTQTLDSWLDRGLFLQTGLVADYVVAFANAYRQALASHQDGGHANVALAWLQSFDACRDPPAARHQRAHQSRPAVRGSAGRSRCSLRALLPRSPADRRRASRRNAARTTAHCGAVPGTAVRRELPVRTGHR